MTSLLMTAVPLAGVASGPLSGWVLERFAGLNGWAGWQWLFLLQGIPSVLGGLLVLAFLDDGIAKADWLDGHR